jgi:putative restriction endonuclease
MSRLSEKELNMGVLFSSSLTEGEIYTRSALSEMLGSIDATINTGIFQPRNYDSILLFITEKKPTDRTQYVDRLVGDTLYWQGQTEGRKDTLIITHEEQRIELLVFYRSSKNEYPGSGFKFEGRFRYRSHTAGQPTSFVLERVGDGA